MEPLFSSPAAVSTVVPSGNDPGSLKIPILGIVVSCRGLMIWNALPAVLTVVFKSGGAVVSGLRVCNSLCARGVG